MKIVTAVVNNPLFIKIQYYTLKRYYQGEYEFIVFNDCKDFPDFTNGNDITVKSQIEEVCAKLQIKCINIPNEKHKYLMQPSDRTADSMNYILQYQIANPDKYLVLDSDMFLVDYFNIDKYAGYDCAIVLQSRNESKIKYMWNGLYYFDMTRMKNVDLLNWNCSIWCDTGGMTQEWLKRMGDKPIQNMDDIYYIQHLSSCSWDKSQLPANLEANEKLNEFLRNDIRNENGKFFCEIYDNVFLHYRAGGNWRREGLEVHKILSQKIKDCLIKEEPLP